MASVFDRETLDELRKLEPRQAYDRVRQRVFQAGGKTSEDFREAFEELVEQGILTWEQLEEFEG